MSDLEKIEYGSSSQGYGRMTGRRRFVATEHGLDAEDASSLTTFILSKMVAGEKRSSWRTLAAGHAFLSGSQPNGILPLALKATERLHGTTHHKPASRGNLDRILEHALHTGRREDMRIALGSSMAFGAILRVSETVGLRWQDIVVKEDTVEVKVTRAKNDQGCEGRSTFLTMKPGSLTHQVFTRYITIVPHHPSHPVFPSFSTGSYMSVDLFRKELKRVCNVLSIPVMVPHSLRAGGATESLAQGATVEEVRRRGRWRNASSLDSYIPDSVGSQGGTLPI